MNKKVRTLTYTALLLALLIVLQAATKAWGQIVTGSCVNAVLGVAALTVGIGGGIPIALISPLLAFLLGIAPQIVTVPAIMVGNTVFVVVLALLSSGTSCTGRKLLGLMLAAVLKFVALYLLVVQIICNLAAAPLLASGTLKEPMLKLLPAMFSWPQLVTALIGGAIALSLVPLLKKAGMAKID